MADAGKNWWEQNLEWSLGGSMTPALAEGLKTLPATLAAYRGKTAPQVEPRRAEENSTRTPTVQLPPIKPPVPPPPAPPPRQAVVAAAVAEPPAAAPDSKEEDYPFTLEQLLDPNFCGYVGKETKKH